MPTRVAVVDYHKCHPAKCDHGICLAVFECEHGSLMQEEPYEAPERNPAKWCHGCAKCIQACPFKAIYML
jgi:translation initiation factor RLI1